MVVVPMVDEPESEVEPDPLPVEEPVQEFEPVSGFVSSPPLELWLPLFESEPPLSGVLPKVVPALPVLRKRIEFSIFKKS